MDYSCPNCKGNLKTWFRLLNPSSCPFCQCNLRLNKTKFEMSIRIAFGLYFLAYFFLDHYKVLEKSILIFLLLFSVFLTDFLFERTTNNIPRYVEGVISPEEIIQRKNRVLKIILVFILICIVAILIALFKT